MNSFRSKPVGWRYESTRHYLAARGIKTRYNAERVRYGATPEQMREYEERKKNEPRIVVIEKEGEIPPQSKLYWDAWEKGEMPMTQARIDREIKEHAIRENLARVEAAARAEIRGQELKTLEKDVPDFRVVNGDVLRRVRAERERQDLLSGGFADASELRKERNELKWQNTYERY